MKIERFSFKGWDSISWLLGRKKMAITIIGMVCINLAFDPNLTQLLTSGAVIDGVWAVLEYFVKKYD